MLVLNADTGVSMVQDNAVDPKTDIVKNIPCFHSYRSGGTQSVAASTWTKVQLNTEVFDTTNAFDSITNFRFQPLVAGYYSIGGQIEVGSSAITLLSVAIYKNGVSVLGAQSVPASTTDVSINVSGIIYMNGTTDYLELYGYVTATTPIFRQGSGVVYMYGNLIVGA